MLDQLANFGSKKDKKIDPKVKTFVIETRAKLKSSERRKFMAKVVQLLGKGGKGIAERELGWDRKTIQKGLKELESGFDCVDNFSGKGRKLSEVHLPNLLEDIKEIVSPTSQTDPTFRTTRLYTPLSAKEVRKRLIEDKNYKDSELPQVRTIQTKLNELNFHLSKVAKTKPKKK